MENKWEYQYGQNNQSGQNGINQANSQPDAPYSAQNAGGAQPENGYVNVGSSGTNAANMAAAAEVQNAAQPDLGAQQMPGAAPYGTQPGAQPDAAPFGAQAAQAAQAAQSAQTAQSAADPRGTYQYAYDPTKANQRTSARRPKKSGGSGKKWLLRGVAAVLVAAIGFGGGYCGALLAGTQTRVVTQMAPSANSGADSGSASSVNTAGSAGGQLLNLTDVTSMVTPSVVVITTEQMVTSNSWFGGQYVQSGAGSGVILSSDGYIITCNHVVNGASSIKVTLSGDDTTQYDATVIGGDSQTDIAVIKIEADGLIPATMGDSDALSVGEGVVAVGNPMGRLGGSVSSGIVSALNRNLTVNNEKMNLIQTDASISPGNSGGGLFNTAGQLIGIVNAKSASTEAEGLGFAIPVNTAFSVAQDLMQTGYVTGRPQIGISVVTVNDSTTAAQYGVDALGVYIAAVNEGSGAEKAGLQVGDRIVSVNDSVVNQSSDVTDAVKSMSVGDSLTLQIAREGKLLSVTVTLGEASKA